jgi:hypothetical protein
MSHMPLVLIPAFLVPLFVMLHLTALFQWWQARRAQRPDAVDDTRVRHMGRQLDNQQHYVSRPAEHQARGLLHARASAFLLRRRS